MKRFTQRALKIGLALLALVIIGVLTLIQFSRHVPDWYQPHKLNAEQREVNSDKAEQKLIALQNAAAQARADAYVAAHARQPTTTPDASVIDINFSEDELQALLEKWSVVPIVASTMQRFISDPMIHFDNGQIVLAGVVPDFKGVVSLHFTPGIDEQGRMRIALDRVEDGQVPVPISLLRYAFGSLRAPLQLRTSNAARHAKLDSSGVANGAAIETTVGRLMLSIFDGGSADPFLFVPLASRGSLPVRVKTMSVDQRQLKLSVEPLNADERADFLRRLSHVD